MRKSNKSSLKDLVSDLKRKGYTGIYLGGELPDSFSERIPSDLFGINVITRGGIPFNAITEIEGPPQSFKTTISLGFAKEAQKMYGESTNILWVSTENGVDIEWARNVGVKIPYSEQEIEELKSLGISGEDLDSIIKEQEGGGSFIMVLPEEIEEGLDLAHKMLETGEIHLYVLDSIGAVSAKQEREADSLADAQVARNAQLISKHVRRLHSLGSKLSNMGAKTAILTINQVRSKIGGFSPNPNATDNPGGWQLKHGKVLQLSTRITGYMGSSPLVWGKMVTIKCNKSKVCIPHRECTILYITRGDNPRGLPVGPDSSLEAVELAKSIGLIYYNRSDRLWYYGDDVLHVEGEPVSKDDLPLALQHNPELLKKVQDSILEYHRKLEIRGAKQ